MHYDICIWDPVRHEPLPSTHHEALEIMERLSAVPDYAHAPLVDLGAAMVAQYNAMPVERLAGRSLTEYWGSDPTVSVKTCTTAVYRISLPEEEPTLQIAQIVHLATTLGLVVFDDEDGMCFLPNGGILPEDSREMWEFELQELADEAAGRTNDVPDSRTWWQLAAGELFDAIGRGNKRIY